MSRFGGGKDPGSFAVKFVNKLSADRQGLDAFMARMRVAPPEEQALLMGAAAARFGEDPFGAWEASAYLGTLHLDRAGLDAFQGQLAAATPERASLLMGAAQRVFGERALEWWQAIAQSREGRTKVVIAAPPPGGGGGKAAALAVGALLGNLNAGAMAASAATVSVNQKIKVPVVCNICGVYEGTKSVAVSTTTTTSELGNALGGPVMGNVKAVLDVPVCPVCEKYPTDLHRLAPTLGYGKVQGGWTIVLMIANDVVAERYAILNHAEVSGSTPLAFAAWKGQQDSVATLLGEGVPVDVTDSMGSTPLMLAGAGGHRDTIEVLLAAGASVNATNNLGSTALVLAAANGHQDTVATLLGAGANINAATTSGITALMTAALHGHREVVAVLLAAGADTTARDQDGKSAADLAAEHGQTGVWNQLTGVGAGEPSGAGQPPSAGGDRTGPSSPSTNGQAPQVMAQRQAISGPAAGWYPDPTDPRALCWWDGGRWYPETKTFPPSSSGARGQ